MAGGLRCEGEEIIGDGMKPLNPVNTFLCFRVAFQEERKRLGWSYATLAARSGVRVASVHEALTGKVKTSWLIVEKIANALGWHQELRGLDAPDE